MTTNALIPQHLIARDLGMTWGEARAFVEGQGVKVYPLNGKRRWAVSAREWARIAKELGIATPEQEQRRIDLAVWMASRDADRPGRRARRHPARGSSAPSA